MWIWDFTCAIHLCGLKFSRENYSGKNCLKNIFQAIVLLPWEYINDTIMFRYYCSDGLELLIQHVRLYSREELLSVWPRSRSSLKVNRFLKFSFTKLHKHRWFGFWMLNDSQRILYSGTSVWGGVKVYRTQLLHCGGASSAWEDGPGEFCRNT